MLILNFSWKKRRNAHFTVSSLRMQTPPIQIKQVKSGGISFSSFNSCSLSRVSPLPIRFRIWLRSLVNWACTKKTVWWAITSPMIRYVWAKSRCCLWYSTWQRYARYTRTPSIIWMDSISQVTPRMKVLKCRKSMCSRRMKSGCTLITSYRSMEFKWKIVKESSLNLLR